MINIDDIARAVNAYLDRHPDERHPAAPLLASLALATDITNRSTFTGHVTCSAILINPDKQILHIRHNALGTWLRPGGHVEPSDLSLYEAALRELEEETHIPATLPRPLLDTNPIDIDIHEIPARPSRSEPTHLHFDLRYAFTVAHNPPIALQNEEVSDHQWLPLNDVEPTKLRLRLQPLL